MAEGLLGWIFMGFPDEDLRSMLRPGATHLWQDARAVSKAEGQPVFFLQGRSRGAKWIGSGTVDGIDERWRVFGVHVTTRSVLDHPIPALAPRDSPAGDRGAEPVESLRKLGSSAWENRTIAQRIGLIEFRLRTPYLEDGRDLRLSASDWRNLCRLQPRLQELWPV